MQIERFIDTNILLYGYDLDAPEKRALAIHWLERGWSEPGSTAISVQVLQEFVVNFVKAGHGLNEAKKVTDDFSLWHVVDLNLPLFKLGITIQLRWKLSLWDAMIIAAAKTCGAPILLTEDLNHGQDYDGVRVINPFMEGLWQGSKR